MAIEFERRDAIARIVLSRADVGNAIDARMAGELLACAAECDNDTAIRSVVLTGQGKLFCGGGDLNDFARAGDKSRHIVSEQAGIFHAAISRLARMDKPLVCAVNGPAAGAGLSLAILGDIVLLDPDAHFTFGYPAAGFSPDGGASWLLPRLIGLRKAQEFTFTNRRVGAEEAVAMGLATRIADPIAEAAMRQAEEFAAGPVRAFGRLRGLLLSSFDTSLETQLEKEARAIAASSGDHEGREGVAAFVAGRKPRFDAT